MNLFLGIVYQILQIITLIVLFWGLLGFDIEKTNKRKVIITMGVTLAIAAAYIKLRTIWGLSNLVIYLSVSILPTAVFGIRQFGLVLATAIVTTNFQNLVIGIILIIKSREAATWEAIDMGYSLGPWIMLAVVAGLSYILKKSRHNVNQAICRIHPVWYYALAIILFFIVRGFGGRGSKDALYYVFEGISMIFDTALLLSVFIIPILCVFLIYQKNELIKERTFNQRCIREQTEQYVFLRNTQQELRKFRHDNIAHLSTIQYMAQSGEDDKISAYVTELLNSQEIVKYYDTGNIIGDAVINQYYRMCRDAGIEAVVAGRQVEGIQVTETDLCVILTNIIANAYEAALAAEKKILRIELSNFQSKQFIRVANTAKDHVDIKDGELSIKRSSKADRDSHGFGIQNIKEAVHREGGSVRWYKDTESDVPLIVAEVELKVG